MIKLFKKTDKSIIYCRHCVSGSLDGKLIIWDTWSGNKVQVNFEKKKNSKKTVDEEIQFWNKKRSFHCVLLG